MIKLLLVATVAIYSSAHHGSFPTEPTTLKYKAAEIGGHQSYVIKDIEWTDWGERKADGGGTLKSCVEGKRDDCFTVDAALKAGHLADGYYTKLKVIFGQNAVTLRLPTPSD